MHDNGMPQTGDPAGLVDTTDGRYRVPGRRTPDDGAGRGTRAGDAAPRPEPEPDPPAMSEVTRLLSIGAHIDSGFAAAVIDELLTNRQRLAAPAYGYDAATVLGHALAARKRKETRTTLLVAAFGQWLVLGVLVDGLASTGSTLFWVTSVLALWGAWATVFIDRAITRQIVTVHLRRPRTAEARYGFDGSAPSPGEDLTEVFEEIREEQETSSGVVHYSGYMPFVGAGDLERSWSFAVLLDPASRNDRALPIDTAPEPPARPIPFTAAELTSYVEEKLTTHLLTEVRVAGERLDGLEVTRRLYTRAMGHERPDPQALRAPSAQGADEHSEHYRAAREFLTVRVGSWSQELVLTVFLNFDLKGRVLYTQLHAYQLMPIKAAYHQADLLPRGLTGKVLVTLAGRALAETLTGVGRAAGALILGPLLLASRVRRGRQGNERGGARQTDDAALSAVRPHEDDQSPFTDWGARHSVRELGASPVYHHYFQKMDRDKYFKVIERRTLEVILDFLDDHNVDTAEYRMRQTEVLNIGILQTGAGTIVNSGATAAGAGSSAFTKFHTRD